MTWYSHVTYIELDSINFIIFSKQNYLTSQLAISCTYKYYFTQWSHIMMYSVFDFLFYNFSDQMISYMKELAHVIILRISGWSFTQDYHHQPGVLSSMLQMERSLEEHTEVTLFSANTSFQIWTGKLHLRLWY